MMTSRDARKYALKLLLLGIVFTAWTVFIITKLYTKPLNPDQNRTGIWAWIFLFGSSAVCMLYYSSVFWRWRTAIEAGASQVDYTTRTFGVLRAFLWVYGVLFSVICLAFVLQFNIRHMLIGVGLGLIGMFFIRFARFLRHSRWTSVTSAPASSGTQNTFRQPQEQTTTTFRQ